MTLIEEVYQLTSRAQITIKSSHSTAKRFHRECAVLCRWHSVRSSFLDRLASRTRHDDANIINLWWQTTTRKWHS